MQRVRVKICGITNEEDAHIAVKAGADALGLVFYEPSPRAIDMQTAAKIAASVPALVNVVGLFVNASADYIAEVMRQVHLDQLQFHGSEDGDFCRQFGRRYVKAVPMNDLATTSDIHRYVANFSDASALLFDAYGSGASGGSGQRFGWRELPQMAQPMIIAGGLRPDNVAQVIEHYHPFAVDVSSGVETAPGRKSSVKINNFIQAVPYHNHDY